MNVHPVIISTDRIQEKSKSGVKNDYFSFRDAGYKVPIVYKV